MTKKVIITPDNPNGIISDLTAEEISARQVADQENETLKQQIETDKQAKETAQASGNQKLLDLGLSQAECTALTGYTPPVAE
jgi:hypothetical protein